MGKEGKYDLSLASPPSPVTSDTDTEESADAGKYACMQCSEISNHILLFKVHKL